MASPPCLPADAPSAALSVKTDDVRLFMLYTLFGGDTKRVSAVSGVDAAFIDQLAHDFNWRGKISGKPSLDSETGQENERAINRVANYVSADRLGRVYARLIDELDSDPAFAKAFCTDIDSDSGERSFNTKNLSELAKGLEVVANIKYRALGDKQAQQADVTGKQTGAEFSLTVYHALAKRFDRNLSVDTSAEIVKAVADVRDPEATAPTS